MSKKITYYHILEHGEYGNIGHQGYFESEDQANKQIEKLSDFFPDLYFTIWPSLSKNEPEIVTV